MFLKPFCVRSNSQIKSCEKKQLLNSFYDQYQLNSTDLLDIFKIKDVHRVKIITSSELRLNVFKFGSIPLIIEHEKELLPTVYLLWHLPEILPHFKIQENLISVLMNGAVINGPLLPNTFNKIEKNVLCCISTTTNRAPIAIGRTAMSNYDMYMSAGKGKAVSVLHIIGDHICSLASSVNRPILPWPATEENQPKMNEECKEVMNDVDCESESPVPGEPHTNEELNKLQLEQSIDAQPPDLDLNQLPIQVNIFYSQYVLVHKPPSVDLDIKKTKFKKVGAFLKTMQEEGFIEVAEPKPGVLILNRINKGHIELRDINVPPPKENSNVVCHWPDDYMGPPTIEDIRIIKGPVAALFSQFGHKPGECISQSEARQAIDNYVRIKKLQFTKDLSIVCLDKLLMDICDPKTFVESPESTIANPVFKKLTTAYRIRYPNLPTPFIWNKKEPPQIHLYTVTKAGKKLTRIAELEIFHINPDAFSKHLKTNLACSAGRTEDQQYPGKTVIQAQGVHLAAISKLLTESYGIPKRLIRGYTEPDKKK
ncbi:unnamed protein product [Heterobilharzia americana]|nr:unnamed protein product [Heterobilharzia americana]